MADDYDYSYHTLSCGSEEQAQQVMAWLDEQREQGINITVADIRAQFPFVELVVGNDVPQELRKVAEMAMRHHAEEMSVQRTVNFVNKVATIFFGFGSTAVVMLHRYWLNADVEPALWLVQSWWLFPIWIGVLGFSVWLWPKE